MSEKTNGSGTRVSPDAKKLTKTEAVKRSLEKLGKDAMPKAIQADVMQRFGVEVTADYAGKVKALILNPPMAPRKESAGKGASSEPTATKPALGETRNGQASTIHLDDIVALKELFKRVGADHLKTLIGVLEK